MSLTTHLAPLLALALAAGHAVAGEAKKGQVPKGKEPPAATAPGKQPSPESKAERAERLAELYRRAEGFYAEERYREAQRLYARIALEEPNYRRVASRLKRIRALLKDEEERARQARLDSLLELADARFAAGDYEAAAKACETILAIDPANRRAQRRLAEAAGELEVRRRVTSIVAEESGERELLAQAKPAAAQARGPQRAAAAPGVPVTKPAPGVPVAKRAPGAAKAGESPPQQRAIGPGRNVAAQPIPGRQESKAADAEGRRALREAWDLCERAKLADDPRPLLHKALDLLAPITPTSDHSQRLKETAALVRRSIARRLAEGGRELGAEELKRARLHERYLAAEDLFRKERYEECVALTAEILKEDPGFALARQLSHEARMRVMETELAEKDLEHRLAVERQLAEFEELSVPPQKPTPVQRPPIDLSHPSYEVSSPELEEKLNQRVSVNLIEADLDYLLDLLFRSTGVNLIYKPEDVQGKTITIHVINYPLRQLLDYIARNHGLTFVTTPDGVLITTPDQPQLESFIIPLNYGLIDVEVPPPSGQVTGQNAAAQPIVPPATSNVEKLIANLPQLMDWPQGSFTYLDRKMNLLYVRTTREAYGEMVRLLEPVDQIPIQVLIKALFVEINADDFESSGVQLSFDGELRLGSIGGTRINLQSGDIFQFGADTPTQEAGTNPTLRLAGVTDEGTFEFILDALQRTGRARTLAAPNVICVNNSSAMISVTKTLVYIEDYEVDRADISGVSYGYPYPYTTAQQQQQAQYPYGRLSSEPVITPVFSEDEYTGFTLDVSPSVGRDTRYVTLVLNPRIREEVLPRLTFDLYLPATGGVQTTTPPTDEEGARQGLQKVTVERPVVAERALATQLTVADGSVVILGGLIQHKKSASVGKVPILGDIPLLGHLFSRKTYRDEKTNLLIFVQAEVVTPTGARYADSGQVQYAPAAQGGPIRVQEQGPPVVKPAQEPQP